MICNSKLRYSKCLVCDFNVLITYYIKHKNIPVILLVNTTSRDIKYHPQYLKRGKKFLYKMDISLVLRDVVGISPILPMPTLIMWLPWRQLVLVFTDSDQNFWYKLYQIENLGLVSDGVLEILLWQCWWFEHQCIGHIHCHS